MKPHVKTLVRRSAAALAAFATLSLVGCSVRTASSDNSIVSLAGISGSVHGGQQPVSGARVYLFAGSTSGYGTSAQSILNGPGYVTTNSAGGFSITGDYTCPSNAQVYLVAYTGNPGLAAGTNNGALTLLAGLGSCSALTASTNVTINEVSTAAMTYALSGFMSNFSQVATSATNAQGLARAFASIPNMIDVPSGTVRTVTPGGNGTVPVAEINSLADAIAPCVNSNGTDGNCAALFSATTVSGSTAPNDTVTALLSIAQNPSNNVSQIFNLVTPSAPFQPTLTTAPNDWTVAMNYTGNGLANPFGLALDIAGNVYVTNPGSNSVSEFDYKGAPVASFTANTFSNPRGISSDTLGNVYVANFGSNNLVRISNAGIVSTFVGGGLNGPVDVAVDGSDAVYAVNQSGSSVSAFTPAGVSMSGTNGFTGGGLNSPSAIAIDSTGQLVVTNFGGNSVSKLTAAGVFASPTGYTGAGLNNPVSLAIDGSNNIYVANQQTSVAVLTPTGVASPGTPFSGGGTGTQAGIAISGASNIFVAQANNSIKVLRASGVPKSSGAGFQGGGLNSPARIGLDPSGNLWVANNGSSNGSITEFIGIGAPTQAPLSSALKAGTIGNRP